ncbi:MAG: glycogen/starch/alpha-glucan phosphorylase, partial [Desulfobulbaceae bacterium]|nr:glycogen/starch/alpha-glucan phosphorylase [Desulfobulbaceae bacterium]
MPKKTIINPDQVLRSMLSSNKLGTFFGVSQEVLDNVWNSLTSPDGNSVTYISMEIGADRDVFHPVQTRLLEMDVTGSTHPDIDKFIRMFLKGPSKIPNYGGGLGILAGDTLKSFADNKIPVLGISLLYKKGYFSQLVDSQIGQIAWNKEWEPENTASLYLLKDPENPDVPLQIQVPFFNRNDEVTYACAQLLLKMEVADDLEFFVPEVLLDFSVESSPDFIKDAAQLLYDSSSERTKAIQRRLLGAGVVPVMKALGVTSKTIHLNEQHGVTVVLNLIRQLLEARLGHEFAQLATDQDIHDAAREVAERIIYTIHTPVKAGHDRFDRDLFSDIAHSFSLRVLNLLADDREQPSHFNFTTLAMHVNRATNSVSRLHKEVTKRQFPQYSNKITAVT